MGDHRKRPQRRTTAGHPSRRPQQETTAGDHSGRQQRETTAGDHSVRPQRETTAGNYTEIRRPQRETTAGNLSGRPAEDDNKNVDPPKWGTQLLFKKQHILEVSAGDQNGAWLSGLLSIILITRDTDYQAPPVLPRQNAQSGAWLVPGGNVAFSFAPTVQAEVVPGECLLMPAINFNHIFSRIYEIPGPKFALFRERFGGEKTFVRGTTRSRFIRRVGNSFACTSGF